MQQGYSILGGLVFFFLQGCLFCYFAGIVFFLFTAYLDHIVMADKDGVLLQLSDGHDVHQLVSGNNGLGPVLVLQLVRMEPGAAGVEVDHIQLQRSAVISSSDVDTN